MQLSKKWLLLVVIAAPLLFVPPSEGSSQGTDSTVAKPSTDSLERAVTNFVKAVDKVGVKADVVEAKIIENEKKEREINRLVNRLIAKADKPKIVIKKVVEKVPIYVTVQDTGQLNTINVFKAPQYGGEPKRQYWQPVSGIKKFFNRIFKKKNHAQ